ncbi:MAG: hemolysin family protein [Peptoniphilaceae bacterium]|nr:hemolysin family protein [Peptoniphilaceae bacterium]MDY3738653.1 hemolysin family protein [Peptoniphilaceae bacterium]
MEESGPGSYIIQIIFVIFLLFLNSFLTAIQMGFTSLDSEKLKIKVEDGDDVAERILKISKKQAKFVSMCELLKLFLELTTIVYSINKFKIYYVLKKFPLEMFTFFRIAFIILLVLVYIIFCDNLPKRFAIGHSYNIAKKFLGLVNLLMWVSSPFLWIIEKSTALISKIFGIETKKTQRQVTVEEISSMVQIGENQGVIKPLESQMINSVIGLEEKLSEEIMTARPEVFMIDINAQKEEYLDELLEKKNSRIPVYDEEIDNIIGILYLKDYLIEASKIGFENVNIKKLIKPGYFVPERIEVNKLFTEMQLNNTHIALLIDEYGGFSGIVTMEDLIEEIVGNLDDKYDADIPEFRKIKKGEYVVQGFISIKDLNNKININIDENLEDYDTLAGFMIYKLGYVPDDKSNSQIIYNGYRLKILKIEETRIKTIEIKKVGDEV